MIWSQSTFFGFQSLSMQLRSCIQMAHLCHDIAWVLVCLKILVGFSMVFLKCLKMMFQNGWCFNERNFQRVNNNEAHNPQCALTSWIPSLSHALLYNSISPQKQDHSMITQSCSLHAWTEFPVNNTQLWTTTIRVTQIVDESQGGFVFRS